MEEKETRWNRWRQEPDGSVRPSWKTGTALLFWVLLCCFPGLTPTEVYGSQSWQVVGVGGTAGNTLTPISRPALHSGAGLTINLNKGAGLLANPAASSAFDRAAQFYENLFSDPVTVNIDADLAALGPGILGSTSSKTFTGGYTPIRNAMVNDQDADVGPGDITDFLPTSAQASFVTPSGPFSVGGMSLTSANAKALGFTVTAPSDASITFSSTFSFDFDPSDGIDPGAIDFEAVAIHEIGHSLGFTSEVDYVDYLLNNALTDTLYPTTLDLFRLEPGDGDLDFTNSSRLLVPGGIISNQVSYLGAGQEFLMSTGAFTGDGEQASHWKDNLGIGLMDPTLAFGELGVFTAADLRAFDLIGWNVAAVPEPGSLLLMGTGLAGLIGLKRKWKN